MISLYSRLSEHRLAYHANRSSFEGQVPLLLVHGFCESSQIWTDWLTHLDPAIPVLAIDLPGFGQSEFADVYHISDYVAAVHTVLTEKRIHTCVWTGHSLGAYVGLAYLAQHPAMCAGLSLFHSHPFVDTPERIQGRERAIALLEAGHKDLYVAQLFPALFSALYLQKSPETIKNLVLSAQQIPSEAIISALRAMMGRSEHTATLSQANCPIQYILGLEDTLVDYTDNLKIAARTNIADIQLLPGVAHMGMFEAPAITAKSVVAFYHLCIDLQIS